MEDSNIILITQNLKIVDTILGEKHEVPNVPGG